MNELVAFLQSQEDTSWCARHSLYWIAEWLTVNTGLQVSPTQVRRIFDLAGLAESLPSKRRRAPALAEETPVEPALSDTATDPDDIQTLRARVDRQDKRLDSIEDAVLNILAFVRRTSPQQFRLDVPSA
jgi:hypothetical protein